MKNYYNILGISPNASDDEIKKAYRNLAKKYHPDVYSGNDGDEKMKDLNEAYENLINHKNETKFNYSYPNSKWNNYEQPTKYNISTEPIITHTFIDFDILIKNIDKPITEVIKYTYEYQKKITEIPTKKVGEVIFDKNIFTESNDKFFLVKTYIYDISDNNYNLELIFKNPQLGSDGFSYSWPIGDMHVKTPLHISYMINNIPKNIEFNFNNGNVIQHTNINLIDIIKQHKYINTPFNKKIKILLDSIKIIKDGILIKISNDGLILNKGVGDNYGITKSHGKFFIKLHIIIDNEYKLNENDKNHIIELLEKNKKDLNDFEKMVNTASEKLKDIDK